MFDIGNLIRIFGLVIIFYSDTGTARFCDGGHRCSPPKECCAQGCCYLYAPPTVPRTTPPPSDHVLNLFFINHWYFWCVVFALLLAILCACSLWKRRRQLCNWDAPIPSSQSEGDSAGSCYAPPQYSRCSSFHHAPPPYTEVAAKPDLYPILFTCNGDSVKNGASYLMVQYFRNYIVRPAAGSLSAASTVDSLSSSFICTVNESNTLVPPPYSRAASPDHNSSSHSSIPRSASHHICLTDMNNCFRFNTAPFAAQATTRNNNRNHNVLRLSESANFENVNRAGSSLFGNAVILSRSDQEFKYNIVNAATQSNGSPGGVSGGCGITGVRSSSAGMTIINADLINSTSSDLDLNSPVAKSVKNNINHITNSSSNNSNILDNVNQTNSTNNIYSSTAAAVMMNSNNNTNPLNSCDSYGSIGEFSIMIPEHADKNMSMSLITEGGGMSKSCHLFQNYNKTNKQNASFNNSEESPISLDIVKKFESIRSLVNSNTGSAVSSLANFDSPGSPPRATSPTAEVRELLEQINKLHNSEMPAVDGGSGASATNSIYKPYGSDNQNTSLLGANDDDINGSTLNNYNSGQNFRNNTQQYNSYTSCSGAAIGAVMTTTKNKRPSSLQTRKSKFLNKTTKCLYTPIINEKPKLSNTTTTGSGSSSVATASKHNLIGANSSQLSTNRNKRSWISRSAPTTPGSLMPSNRMGDNSPLLFDHDEEYEQNV